MNSGQDNTPTMTDTAPGSDATGMSGMGMTIEKMASEQQKKKEPTKWDRKMKRIFGEATAMKKNFQMGFMMGGLVGGCMGGLTGLWFALQYR